MRITQLQLKNFRCFAQLTIDFSSPIILISGLNGAGKTSLLEALHYLGYLRSFRATTPRDLVHFGQQEFFIKVLFELSEQGIAVNHELQVGFSSKKRLVKINQRAISSFKELMDYYRIITLTEDDLDLIKGGPEGRRSFIDQALIVLDPEYLTTLKSYKQILDNRNALLQRGSCSKTSYDLWTEQLWHISLDIVKARKALLERFGQYVNQILADYFGQELTITLRYQAKNNDPEISFGQFITDIHSLHTQEMRFGRSLFGAHLDDIQVHFQDKNSRSYASRGQQKLIVLLLKLAHLHTIKQQRGPCLLLLDDFMTDFDDRRIMTLMPLLISLQTQCIVTSPAAESFFDTQILKHGAQRVEISV